MAKNIAPAFTPTHDEIAAQAYQIYLREGCVPGRDIENWLQAENELRLRATPGNGKGNGQSHSRPNSADASKTVVDTAIAGGSPLATPIPTTPPRVNTPRRANKREREMVGGR